MSEKRAAFITGVLLIAASAAAQKSPPPSSSHRAPVAPVKTVVDEYFGMKVSDPYRYMEDLKDPEVAAWFRGENDYTRAVLERIPGRNALLQRIKELDEGAPAVVSDERRLPGDRIFYRKRLATEETPRLYVREGLNGAEKLLVNPDQFKSAAGSHYAIDYYAPSLDGRYIAFGVSPGGSEDAVLHVLNVETGQETGDVIDRAQFGNPGWLSDGRSFVYTRLQKLGAKAAPTDKYLKSRVYLHVMGTDPEKDTLVFGIGLDNLQIAPADIPFAGTVAGSAYVLGVIAHGVQNEITLYAAPLKSLRANPVLWTKVCDVDDQITNFDVHGDEIYLLSHLNASRFKVLRTRLSHPDVSHADLLIPPGEAVIRNLGAARDALYVQEIDGGIGHLLRLPYGSRNARGSVAANSRSHLDRSDGRARERCTSGTDFLDASSQTVRVRCGPQAGKRYQASARGEI